MIYLMKLDCNNNLLDNIFFIQKALKKMNIKKLHEM